MKYHVITGLPRSGSTLLCNVLNQNPRFNATSTSEMPRFLSSISHQWTNSLEVKNELNMDKEKTEEKMQRTMKSFVESWYGDDHEVVFDKSRGWAINSLMLNKLYPDAKMIVCVRDLRNVYSSVEKQHRKNPVLDEANNFSEKSLTGRAMQMFSEQGLIGGPIMGIEDAMRRSSKNVYVLKYEDFCKDPEKSMKEIYEFIGEKYFKHQFDDVVNTAKDPDGFYLWKYPHKGEGKISETDPEEYKKYLSPDLVANIEQTFAPFMVQFGYLERKIAPQIGNLGKQRGGEKNGNKGFRKNSNST